MTATKTLKNSVISVIGQILMLVLQFVNRRIFVMFLDIEYLEIIILYYFVLLTWHRRNNFFPPLSRNSYEQYKGNR